MKRLFLLLLSLIVTACTGAITSDTELREEAENIATLSEQWLMNNVREKGLFVYRYNPDTDTTPDAQNELRQLMGSRMLALMSQSNESALPLHRKNLSFIMEYWYKEEDGVGFILFDGKSKLGANAMLLRTLVASPDFEKYESEAKSVADGILKLQNPDGSFRAWLKEPEYEYDEDYLLTFYSGEAILALLEYAEKSSDRQYFDAAKKSQDFYVEEYVTRMDENYYPAYVPWHVMSLHILFKATGDKKYGEAIFTLTDKVLELLDRTRYVGRFYNPTTPQYGTPHSSSDGVYTEGLAHAYALALSNGGNDRASRYEEALFLAVRNLRSLQFSTSEARRYKRPAAVLGGLRTSANNQQIRVDTVQHAWDAMKAIESALQTKEKLKM